MNRAKLVSAAQPAVTCHKIGPPFILISHSPCPTNLPPKLPASCKLFPTSRKGTLLRHSSLSEEELIGLCAESNDGAAWEEFVSRFQRPISFSVIRTAQQWGHTPGAVVDDLVQETYLKLCIDRCRLLRDFATRHPHAILGYIKTIAINVAHDHFKAQHSLKRGSGDTGESIEDVELNTPSDSFGGHKAMELEVLFNQIDRYVQICTAGPDQERDRLIFDLCCRQGFSARIIASLPTVNLTAKGVDSAVSRIKRCVREKVVVVNLPSEKNIDSNVKDFAPQNRFREQKTD